MPPKRTKFVVKKKRAAPKGITRKRKYQVAKSLNLKQDVHYLSRYAPLVDTSSLSTLTSSIGAQINFRLNDVSNPTDFTNLFEDYKIIGVKLTFRLMDNPDSSNYINQTVFTQGANFYPKLWWCVDKNDTTVPTVASIRERPYARYAVLRPDKFITVYVKYPKPVIPMEASGLMTPPVTGWMRCTESSVPHYGLKVVLDKMGYAGNTFTVGIDKKYYYSFRGSR